MRITNKMITSNYLNNLSSLSTNLNTLSTKVSTGRSFLKSSEDAASAVRAYNIRTQLAQNATYKDNVSYASDFLTSSETALDEINDITQEASKKILSAVNGTKSASDRKIIANELTSLQSELLSSLNASSSGTYYFGGTNTDTAPFTVGTGGKLCYNGVALDGSTTLDGSGNVDAAAFADKVKALTSDSRYMDIGLNMAFTSTTDAVTGETTTAVDKSTVLSYSVTGLSITGSGTTTLSNSKLLDGTTKVSNNLYDLLGSVIEVLNAPDATSGSVSTTGTANTLTTTSKATFTAVSGTKITAADLTTSGTTSTLDLSGLSDTDSGTFNLTIGSDTYTVKYGATGSGDSIDSSTTPPVISLDLTTGTGTGTTDLGSRLANLIPDDADPNHYSYDTLSELSGLFTKTSDDVLNSLTVIGAKSSYLNFMSDRLDAQELNLEDLQTSVEGADSAETIVDYTAQQLAYNAALKMGTSLLQPSIFDYMS